jgi:predicted HicB family RNase H-like nuclease
MAMLVISSTRSARVDVRVRLALRQRLVELADSEGRTLSSWIERLLEAAVRHPDPLACLK